MKLIFSSFYIIVSLAYLVEAYSRNNQGPDDDWFIRCEHSEIGCWFPSMSPSKKPSPYQQSRSFPNALSPSAVPSPSPCQVSSSGFYGDESISNLQSEYVRFDYQMEYGPQGNVDKILEDLEMSIMNTILSTTTLFPECSSIRKRYLIRSHLALKTGQQQGNVIGMSSSPVDMITSSECPFDTVFRDSICVVVGGVLTLFFVENSARQLEDHKSEIKYLIERTMNDGSLSMSNKEIIHLEYIGSYRDGDSAPVDPNNGNTSFTLSFLSVSFILLVAAAAIVIVGLFVIMMRRLSRRKKTVTARDPNLDDSSHIAAEEVSITDDDSTNFISSLENSEKTLFRIWRQS